MVKNNSLNWQPVQYNILCGAANGGISNIPPSSISGEVLTSNGASSNPSFKPFASGSWVLLQTQNASASANITFTSTYITSTYSTYVLLYTGVTTTHILGQTTLILSTNNGSSYLSTGYISSCNYLINTTAGLNNNNSTSSILVSSSQLFTNHNGYIIMNNLNTTSNPQFNGESINQINNATQYFNIISGCNTTTTPVNNIQISNSGSVFALGTFTLYGLVQ